MKASENSQLHVETVVMERTYRASPARVFKAWGDVEARTRWSIPSPDVIIVYDKADFRVGGVDDSRCGAPKGGTRLVFTEQGAYYGDESDVHNRKAGCEELYDKLALELDTHS